MDGPFEESEEVAYFREVLEQGKSYEGIEIYFRFGEELRGLLEMLGYMYQLNFTSKIYSSGENFTYKIYIGLQSVRTPSRDDIDNNKYAYSSTSDGDTMIIFTEMEYTDDGYYTDQAVSYEMGGTEFDALADVRVDSTSGYVEPHLSLCKDTMKVNYNRNGRTLFQMTGYYPSTLEIRDANSKTLLTLSNGQEAGYLNVPEDGILVVSKRPNEFTVDGITYNVDGDYGEAATFHDIPLNAANIIVKYHG